MSGASGNLQGNNLYVYCFNNPVNMTDNNGNWPALDAIKKWFENFFSAGVIQAQSYASAKFDTMFVGYETGVSSSKVISGDVSKPVSFFAINASDWWKVWEYKLGIQFNTDNGGYSMAAGIGETSIIFYGGNASTELITGINKLGFTQSYDVDFRKRTAGTYVHGYVRTIPALITIFLPTSGTVPLPLPASYGGAR